MLSIENFTQIPYSKFIEQLSHEYESSGRPINKIMAKTQRKGINLVRNILNKDKQVVPDKILEKAALALKINCAIVLHGGKKYYFISNITENAAANN